MSTIEELLATPQVEEVWEVDNRYVINSSYSDDQGPIEIVGKDIGDMSSQISIQGESISQYVEFIMPRYYDNIDLSEKNIVIHYTAGDRGGENAPINVYKSQERIKFGWAIPASATANEGTLSIGVWARGYVGTEEYMWKSRIAYYKVERGPVLGEGLSEPDVQWYLDFVREMDAKVTEASLYSTRAKQSENVAVESKESAIASSQTASDSANTAVRKAAEASSSASVASAHSTAAKVSADNAKESETKAQGYAEEARNNAEGFEPISDMMTGTNPTAQNSTNAPFIYGKFKGYTKQQMYSGKNLCDNNNFTLTAGTGTVQSNYVYQKINIADKLKSDTTYILSADVKIIAGTPNEISIALLDEGLTDGSEIVSEGAITNNHAEVAIESGSNASDFYYLLVYAGVKGSTAGNSIEFSNVMFRESTTDATYEPYVGGTTSPNPDYPQEINGLAKGGAIEVKTCGKNLSSTGNLTGTLDTFIPINHLVDGTTYTLSCVLTSTDTDSSRCVIYKRGSSGEKFLTNGIRNTRMSLNFTKESGDTNIRIFAGSSYDFSIGDTITINDIQIEEGTTATPYEPYQGENTAAIPTDAPLYEGDYLEVYADGSGKEYHKMKEIVLDETRSYGASDSADSTGDTIYFHYAENIELYKENGIIKCDKLTERRGLYTADAEGILYEGSVGYRSIRFRIKKSRLVSPDVAGLKAWLAENPLHIVAELAKPTATELTAEQVEQFKKLYTFEPVTNVLCDGEVEMIYFRNNPNGRVAGMLQRQIDSITSALSTEAEES